MSPRTGKDQVFSIPLEEALEELEQAGVVGEEGYSTERVLQVGRAAGWVWPHGKSGAALDILHWTSPLPQSHLQELDLVSGGSVNLRSLASSMDQYLATPAADKSPVASVMRQIASKAYRNELQLLR